MLYFRSLASRGGVETFVVFLLWPKKMVEKSFVYIHSQAYFFYRLKFVFKKFSRKMWKLRFFSVSLTYIQRDCSISPSLHVFIRHSLGESSVNHRWIPLSSGVSTHRLPCLGFPPSFLHLNICMYAVQDIVWLGESENFGEFYLSFWIKDIIWFYLDVLVIGVNA